MAKRFWIPLWFVALKKAFDVDRAKWQQAMTLSPESTATTSFILPKIQLPKPIPASWTISDMEDGKVKISLPESSIVKVDSERITR